MLGIERSDGIDGAQRIGDDAASDRRGAAPTLARLGEVDGVLVGAHPDIILPAFVAPGTSRIRFVAMLLVAGTTTLLAPRLRRRRVRPE